MGLLTFFGRTAMHIASGVRGTSTKPLPVRYLLYSRLSGTYSAVAVDLVDAPN